MITYYQKTITSKRLKTIEGYKAGSWVYIEKPTEEEIMYLAEELKLDESILRDATDPHEVPRVEVSEGITYIFSRYPFQDEGLVSTSPVLLGVAEGYIFTVTSRPLPFLDKFVEGKIEFNTTQKIRFLLQILGEIDAAYNQFIVHISREVRKLQMKLHSSISNHDIVSFVHFESVLSDLLDALQPTNIMLQSILSGKVLTLYEQDKEYIEDLYLETGQLIERSRTNLRTIINIRDAYSTIMSNNLNRTIKFLTGITIILSIPAILVNLFGMNLTLPFDSSHPAAFWLVLVFMAAVTALTYWFFSRKHLV